MVNYDTKSTVTSATNTVHIATRYVECDIGRFEVENG